MRFAALLRSDKHFGNLTRIHGEYKFSLSPNEQSAFKGWGTQLYNMVRDQVGRNWWKVALPLTPAYLLYDWAIKANYQTNRKNPADYENEE